MANWLKSEDYLRGHPNAFTFDLFDHLAEDDPNARDYNMLKKAYRNGADSHPNATANQRVGPIFADFIVEVTRAYRATYRAVG